MDLLGGLTGNRRYYKSHEALQNSDSHNHDSNWQGHDEICSLTKSGMPKLPPPDTKFALASIKELFSLHAPILMQTLIH